MRILIDALPLTNASGTGYYVQKLLAAFSRMPTGHEFLALTPPLTVRQFDTADWPGGEHLVVLEDAPARPALQAAWRQWRLPRLAKRYGVDLVHYPAFLGSLRGGVPSVVTIPDLVWRQQRETIPPRKRGYYDRVIPRTMEQARAIIAISAATAELLAADYPQHAEKTRTVHLGVDRRIFRPLGNTAETADIRERYRLPLRFALALGTLEPRKNLDRLVRAFERIAPNVPAAHLVIAGKDGYRAQELRAQIRDSPIRDRVLLPGHIPAADLPAVYNLADAFILPSLSEGFGLPILEAMACGVPVVTSNRSSMAEIAGDAAELVDPESVDAIGRALVRTLVDTSAAEVLRTRGLARAAQFSWERTAAHTIRVYEEALA